MISKNVKHIVKRASKYEKIAIVGLGRNGRELYDLLDISDVKITHAFDNSLNLVGKTFKGVVIAKPYKVEGNCLYVITVAEKVNRCKLLQQLADLNILETDIEIYYSVRDYDYMKTLDSKCYVEEVQDIFFERFGYDLNVDNPRTYNEKICVDKVCNRDPRKSLLSDKYKVKDWVKEKIGEEYVVKSYGAWDDAFEIDFSILPQSFVLKVNNASGHNIVVKDKSKVDRDAVCKQLNEWLKEKFGFLLLELHYNDIQPKIICDEYLEGLAEEVYDYNIYCFHGEPKYIWCIKGSHKENCQAAFYDTDWNKLDFEYGYPIDEEIAPRPTQLKEMLELSAKLSKEFKHVRVDWYNLPDGRVLFGEMSFTTWGGNFKIEPEEYDLRLGELI